TRCPDCNTTFRITPEALGKAAGQVRCGRCACVFDAYTALMEHDTAPERTGARAGTAVEDPDAPPAPTAPSRSAAADGAAPPTVAAEGAAPASAAPDGAAQASAATAPAAPGGSAPAPAVPERAAPTSPASAAPA